MAARAGIAGGNALQGVPGRARLGLRQLCRAAKVTLRLRFLSQALGEARELEARATRVLEREARLEEALRLAPELGLRAKPAERREQLGVAAAAREPAFGALDAHARFLGALAGRQLRRQFAVKADQLRVPLGAERVLEDFARQAALAERRGVARRGRGDARMQLVARGNLAPAPLEVLGVVGRALQQLDVGLHLVFLGQRRRDGLALEKQPGEAPHLVPGARAALGAQQKPRRADVARRRALQPAQGIARGAEVALFQRELGAADEVRGLRRIAGAAGALEPAVASLELAQLMRRACGEQRREAGRRADVEGERGFLLRAPI